MFNHGRRLLPLVLVFGSHAIDMHIRAGIDLTTLSVNLNSSIAESISFGALGPILLPNFSAEIRKPIDEKISFGLSGSYQPLYYKGKSCYGLKTSFHSYLNYNQFNSISIGLHIHHVPLRNFYPILPPYLNNFAILNGYLNNLSFGIAMQGTLSDELYAHFEIKKDITPFGSKSYELLASSENTILFSMLSLSHFSSNFSIGYKMPSSS